MIKLVLLLILLLFHNKSNSQLYVSGNTYVYNKEKAFFIKGNLELADITTNFYLRNEGQLIQGTTAISTNKGTGNLSVFQEGTVNNYAYNYWCSPVGNTVSITGNGLFGITMLNVPSSKTASSSAVALPYSSLDGTSSTAALAISSRWIWRFLTSDLYSDWIYSGSNTDISAGQGFTMKGTSGTDPTNIFENTVNNPGSAQRYDFRGRANDGNITINVLEENYTLTGNPYPSSLNLNAFLLDSGNTAGTGIAYYWEQKKTVNSHYLDQYEGGYGTYSPISLGSNGIYIPATFDTYTSSGDFNTTGASSGLVIERKYVPIGQGFMVEGASAGTLQFKNSHRVYYKESTISNSSFEKNASKKSKGKNSINDPSHIRFNVTFDDKKTRQIALAFTPEATDGVDFGIDAISPLFEDGINDAYFPIEKNNYVIEGINFDVEKRVPFGTTVNALVGLSISLARTLNFNENQPIYLYDSFDNSYHDLRDGVFETKLDAGTYNTRFQITFKNDNALGVSNSISRLFTVIQNNKNKTLTISNPSFLDLKKISIYDISGKLILSKLAVGNTPVCELPTAKYSDGFYIVKLQTKDGDNFTKKIIILNNN